MTITEEIRQRGQKSRPNRKYCAQRVGGGDQGDGRRQTNRARAQGGHQEEQKKFTLDQARFLLYPTYDHQRADLLQPPFVADLDACPIRRGVCRRRCYISHYGQRDGGI